MKALILASFAVLSVSVAQAAPVSCSTNVDHNPKQDTTFVTIEQNGSVVQASMNTIGGMAKFATLPKTFIVSTQNVGPEVVIYSNVEEGFDLTVGYQPMGGKIYGTLVEVTNGKKDTKSVLCSVALN